MRMLFLLAGVLLVSGCVAEPGFTGCDPDQSDFLRGEIEKFFGLEPGQYIIENASCSGALSFSVTGTVEGEPFRLEEETAVSSSPSSYQEYCISSADEELFTRARDNLCGTLESRWSCPAWNQSCESEEYDNTTETRELCRSGYYDMSSGGTHTIGIRQEHHYSWISIVSNETMLCG